MRGHARRSLHSENPGVRRPRTAPEAYLRLPLTAFKHAGLASYFCGEGVVPRAAVPSTSSAPRSRRRALPGGTATTLPAFGGASLETTDLKTNNPCFTLPGKQADELCHCVPNRAFQRNAELK